MVWKKGQSGNPNGRPEGSVSIVAEIKNKLKEIPDGSKKTYLQQLVETIFKKSIKDKDVKMITDIINRVDGKAKESVDVTTGGDKILQIYAGKSIPGYSSDKTDIQPKQKD